MGMATNRKKAVSISPEVVAAIDTFARDYHVPLSRNTAAELLVKHALTAHGISVADGAPTSSQNAENAQDDPPEPKG